MKLRFFTLFFLWIIFNGTSFAQFGYPMGSVILPSTDTTSWLEIKRETKERIIKYWGESPVPYSPLENVNFRIESKYVRYDLTHIDIRYEVLPESWDRAVLVLPRDFTEDKQYKTVVIVHGSNQLGADAMLDSIGRPDRSYAIELANRGFVCFVPDHYAHGKHLENISQDSLYENFYIEYPNWSLVGRQLLGYIRSLDVLDVLSEEYNIDNSNGYGIMGNSLGGRTSLYLTAVEDRVSTSVISTGVSPMISNTYRGLNRMKIEQPQYWDYVVSSKGLYPWEYNEMIAICAPKSLLFFEPINDPYNPYVDFTVQALILAAPAWRLLGKPENFSFLIHGDGHQTYEYIRDYAYNWFERKL